MKIDRYHFLHTGLYHLWCEKILLSLPLYCNFAIIFLWISNDYLHFIDKVNTVKALLEYIMHSKYLILSHISELFEYCKHDTLIKNLALILYILVSTIFSNVYPASVYSPQRGKFNNSYIGLTIPSKYKTFSQCWFNAGLPSVTLDQHLISIG